MTDNLNQGTAEIAERRAESTRQIQAATGLDVAMLERLVRAFYGAARQDDVLGPSFDHVSDWDAHIAAITAFWSSAALATGSYSGRPLAAHLPLDLKPRHFARWLDLFERAARDICPAAGAELLIEKAQRIAKSLEIGAAAHRGELPGGAGRDQFR
ncbi:MAG: group III truncated hemoglobin [Beijerinckiaceae bacterium]|nr:group III truncated hemoglobin [Beijerinckiaceae bacterium]